MDRKRTLNNLVLIKLDPENTMVRGLFIDTTFNPEMHCTVTGEVYGIPSHLQFTGQANIGMPWDCDMELKYGDKVVVYYLSIVNALNRKDPKCVYEGDDRFVLIPYDRIYATMRDGKITPINGYVLTEEVENPAIMEERTRMEKMGLKQIILRKNSITNVVYSRVKYLGKPNRRYTEDDHTDEGVDIAVGDIIISKKVSDIPMQYSLHQKINQGEKLFRIQRRNIFARL
ncbi:MAG: hypothetical protein ABSA76_02295 [Bacteroidales bacterium]